MNFTIPSLHCSTPGKSSVIDKKADVTVTVAPQLSEITASAFLRRSSHTLHLLARLPSKSSYSKVPALPAILCYPTVKTDASEDTVATFQSKTQE